jgi:rhodanese-related sulfurtransferase
LLNADVERKPAVQSLIEQKNALLVDVRSPGEFAAGHIAGAINVPLDRLPQEWPKHCQKKTSLWWFTVSQARVRV